MHRDVYCSRTLLLGVLVFASAFPSLCQNTGSISGVVVGDDGSAISAVVTANKTTPPAASGRADTGANGAFTISGLPDGTYALCAWPKNGAYLDPCAWSPQIPSAQISQGKAVTNVRLVLAKGSALQVRLNDPGKILDTPPAANKSAPHVLVGIMTERRVFQPLPLAAKDANGRNHQGTIPLDKTVSLHLVGRDLKLTDASGATVDLNGTTIPVKQATGDKPQTLTFTVAPKP